MIAIRSLLKTRYYDYISGGNLRSSLFLQNDTLRGGSIFYRSAIFRDDRSHKVILGGGLSFIMDLSIGGSHDAKARNRRNMRDNG